MVRLVFRPYTQLRQTICTSVLLRASIRVSPDLTLATYSSPSFGSHQINSYWRYLYLHKICKINQETWLILLFYLLSLCKISFRNSFTRLFDILLGPCFKTGQFHCIPISSFGKQRIIVLHYLFSSLLLLKGNKNKTQYTNPFFCLVDKGLEISFH